MKIGYNIITYNRLDRFWEKVLIAKEYFDVVRIVDAGNDGTKEFCKLHGIRHIPFDLKLNIMDMWNVAIDDAKVNGENWFCFVPGTQVRMKNEFKNIEDIEVGDEVLTHKGRYRKVTQLHKREYDGEIVNIKPSYSSNIIGMTPNHPVLSTKNFKCYLKDKFCQPYCKRQWKFEYNKSKDKHTLMENCQQGYKNYELDWIESGKLEKRDTVVYQAPIPEKVEQLTIDLADWVDNDKYLITDVEIKCKKKVNSKTIPRFIKADEDFWRLCGYYLAEGHVGKDNGTTKFSFHTKEVDFHNDVIVQMNKYFGLINNKLSVVENATTVVFGSKIVGDFFAAFLGNGSYNKNIPHCANNIPAIHAFNIFLGCWFGDGTTTRDTFKVTSVSRILLYQLRDILLRLNVVSSVRSHVVIYNNKETVAWTLNVGGKGLDVLIDFGMIHPFIEQRVSRLSDGINQDGWTDGYRLYLAIREITKNLYSGFVYNLGVEEDNSYIAEDIIVHNCWTDSDEWFTRDFLRNINYMVEASGNGQNYNTITTPCFELSLDLPICRPYEIYQDKLKNGEQPWYKKERAYLIHQDFKCSGCAHPNFYGYDKKEAFYPQGYYHSKTIKENCESGMVFCFADVMSNMELGVIGEHFSNGEIEFLKKFFTKHGLDTIPKFREFINKGNVPTEFKEFMLGCRLGMSIHNIHEYNNSRIGFFIYYFFIKHPSERPKKFDTYFGNDYWFYNGDLNL